MAADSQAALLFATVYALVCVPIFLYSLRRNSGQEIQVAGFVVFSLVFLAISLANIGVFSSGRLALERTQGSSLSLALMFLFLLAIWWFLLRGSGSSRIFLLIAAAYSLIFFSGLLPFVRQSRLVSEFATLYLPLGLGCAAFFLAGRDFLKAIGLWRRV